MPRFAKLINEKDLLNWAGSLVRSLTVATKDIGLGEVTLTASATTTVVSDQSAVLAGTVTLTPLTATAAAGVATTFLSAIVDGSFTLTHSSDVATDRTFGYVIFEADGGT